MISAVMVGCGLRDSERTIAAWQRTRRGEVLAQASPARRRVSPSDRPAQEPLLTVSRFTNGAVEEVQRTVLDLGHFTNGVRDAQEPPLTVSHFIDGSVKDVREKLLSVNRLAGDTITDVQYQSFLWPDKATTGEVVGEEVAPPLFEVKIIYPPRHPGPWLLTPDLANRLGDFVPGTLSFQPWSCAFSPRLHGVSLRTLYRCFDRTPGPSLLLVRDSGGRIFGGFATEAWHNAGRHYGGGECFVFSAAPPFQTAACRGNEDCCAGRVQVYSWSGRNRFCMFSDANSLAMGGGGSCAISIDGDLLHGSSCPCDTFISPVLSSQRDFVVEAIEFWGFGCRGDEQD